MRIVVSAVLAVALLGILSLGALGGGGDSCSACQLDPERVVRGSCPYTITIQCWCEVWDWYVCCIRQACFPAYFDGPCTDCHFFEDCLFATCGTIYPESVEDEHGRRRML